MCSKDEGLCVKRHPRLPVLLAGFPNASQEDAKIEKTAKSAQKGLEKSAQNVTPDTSDLPNPFDGAGGIADKVCLPAHLPACLPGFTFLNPLQLHLELAGLSAYSESFASVHAVAGVTAA